MLFDPNNRIIQRCAQGMNQEGAGNSAEAGRLFQQAWNESNNNFEKFTSAHYLARHQKTAAEKLTWNETALRLALGIEGERIRSVFPSLYLNVGKCYEDLKDWGKAKENYQLALSFAQYLIPDGYGQLIKSGIMHGIERVIQQAGVTPKNSTEITD